jgi:hypothetical protein
VIIKLNWIQYLYKYITTYLAGTWRHFNIKTSFMQHPTLLHRSFIVVPAGWWWTDSRHYILTNHKEWKFPWNPKQPRTWSSWSFRVQWFEERSSCSFCWYCLNCWPSMFKLYFGFLWRFDHVLYSGCESCNVWRYFIVLSSLYLLDGGEPIVDITY